MAGRARLLAERGVAETISQAFEFCIKLTVGPREQLRRVLEFVSQARLCKLDIGHDALLPGCS